MKTTQDPEIIYDAFNRYGLAPLRIDRFDRGNFAEIRLEIKGKGDISLDDLQQIINNLRLLQKGENVEIRIVHIDVRHASMKVNLIIPGEMESSGTFTP